MRYYNGIISCFSTNFLLLFACLLLLWGCGQVSFGDSPISSIEIDIDESSVIKFSDIYECIRFVKLETSSDNLIGRVDKLIATNDKYIILDRSMANMVFVFNSDGSFSNRIGAQGRGPNEYDEPDDIAYDMHDDVLLILCHNYKTILRFKLDGTFVGKTEFDWWVNSISVVDKNAYLLYFNNRVQPDRKKNDHNIFIVNKEGVILEKLFPYINEFGELYPPQPSFSHFQNEVLFTPNYFNKSYKLENSKIETKYSLDFKRHNIPEASLKNKTNKELDKIIKENDYAYMTALSETTSHVICQYVYRQIRYDCFYSKETGAVKTSSMYFNDMYALLTGQTFSCLKGDSLVSYIDPQFIDYYKSLADSLSNNSDIYSWYFSSLPDSKVKDNFLKIITSTNITMTDTEIDFINSVDKYDNHILMISELKNF